MKAEARRWLLRCLDGGYHAFSRRLLFRISAQRAHELMLRTLLIGERLPFTVAIAKLLRSLCHAPKPTEVGGVQLSQPLIVAAGLVKGRGFADEAAALRALQKRQHNIMPGWRLLPALAGPVEFGSFTRFPRLGNAGTVVWRDEKTLSTQNRVGLRNPGARAAALFLRQRRERLPAEFGINIAVSPGVRDNAQQERDICESLGFFLDAGLMPSWFTLNLSCPNTEDDPQQHQLEAETRRLCGAFIKLLRARGLEIPLWVKVSPGLADGQYRALVRIFDEVGVKAVVATNTLAQPSPGAATLTAGLGGGRLHAAALRAVDALTAANAMRGYALDIIGCGGVLDGDSLHAYRQRGVKAAQYWSALVYRGPFAAAILEEEWAAHERRFEAIQREVLA